MIFCFAASCNYDLSHSQYDLSYIWLFSFSISKNSFEMPSLSHFARTHQPCLFLLIWKHHRFFYIVHIQYDYQLAWMCERIWFHSHQYKYWRAIWKNYIQMNMKCFMNQWQNVCWTSNSIEKQRKMPAPNWKYLYNYFVFLRNVFNWSWLNLETLSRTIELDLISV